MRSRRTWVYLVASLILLAAAVALAAWLRLWVLTAIPIGFLLGFLLQKGELCSASAFSEVLLMRDGRKLFGFWVAVVVSMVGFAVLNLLGLVPLEAKPIPWLDALVGGLIFGVGMVLAGGCVSGCLFKAGTGNINSMAALIGVTIGVAVLQYGPLQRVHAALFADARRQETAATLPSVTGLPYWVLALVFALATLVLALWLRSRRRPAAGGTVGRSTGLLSRSWKPWQAGIAIGLLATLAYVSSLASGRKYPLCVYGGVSQLQALATDQGFFHVWKRRPPKPASVVGRRRPGCGCARSKLSSALSDPPARMAKCGAAALFPLEERPQSRASAPPGMARSPGKKVVWWMVILVVFVVLGSWVSAMLSGQARLLPKPPEQTIWAFLGGILVGIGAALASGCSIGNILSGGALMSASALVFGAAALLGNWGATYFYLMGGRGSRG